jgi:hypothetical protein
MHDNTSSVNDMNRLLTVAIILTMALVGLSLTRPALADVPQVISVVAWNDGGDTKLNVTIYHNGEVPGHYVDSINVTVTIGTKTVSQTFPQSGPHTLDQNTHTFNVTLNFGPLSDTPLAEVQAHCTIYGWSEINWTGSIPEYGLPLLLLTLAGATSVLLMIKHRTRGRVTS